MASGLICMVVSATSTSASAAAMAALAAAAPAVQSAIAAALGSSSGPARPTAAATRGLSSQAGPLRRSPPRRLARAPCLNALGALPLAAPSCAAVAPAVAVAAAARGWEARRGCMTYHCIMCESQAVAPPAEVVQAVAAAAEEQNCDGDALVALARSARVHAAEGALSPGQIRDLCVSFAALGFYDTAFKSAAAKAMLPQLLSFEPSALADTLYAYGLAQHFDFQLMTEAVSHLKAHADRFDAPSLAKMLWAFGRCGFGDDALVEIVGSVARKLAGSCDGPTLADVACAGAQLGWADLRVAALVAGHAADNIDGFDADGLARLLSGLASVGYADEELAGAACHQAVALLESGAMGLRQLASIIVALAAQGCHPAALLSHAEAMVREPGAADALTSDELSALAEAFRGLGPRGAGMVAAAGGPVAGAAHAL